jgi:hypothetical protein
MKSITILGVKINQSENGLYSLYDLWVANGKQKSKQANDFLKLKSTKELILALAEKVGLEQNQILMTVHGGDYRGTFVHEDVVYIYAMWLSPMFYIEVIQVFKDLVNATSILELSQVQDKAIQALEAKTAYLSGQLQVMSKRRPDNENTLMNIIGGSPNTIRLAYMKLVDKGELECVDSIKIEKRYFPTQNSKYVVGQKGSTLLFSDEVKSFVSGQIELDLV